MEFRIKAKSVPRNDYKAVEHWMRYALKQKKLIDMPGFSAANIIHTQRNIFHHEQISA